MAAYGTPTSRRICILRSYDTSSVEENGRKLGYRSDKREMAHTDTHTPLSKHARTQADAHTHLHTHTHKECIHPYISETANRSQAPRLASVKASLVSSGRGHWRPSFCSCVGHTSIHHKPWKRRLRWCAGYSTPCLAVAATNGCILGESLLMLPHQSTTHLH